MVKVLDKTAIWALLEQMRDGQVRLIKGQTVRCVARASSPLTSFVISGINAVSGHSGHVVVDLERACEFINGEMIAL